MDRVECPACGYVGYANAVPGAEAVCLDDEGRVLLGRRAFDPGKGLWDLPGGFLHEDEHPLDGLRREVREETGLEIDPGEFLGFWLEPYDGRIVLCLAWTARVSGEPRAGDDLVRAALVRAGRSTRTVGARVLALSRGALSRARAGPALVTPGARS